MHLLLIVDSLICGAKLTLMSNVYISVNQQVGLCSCMAVQLQGMLRTMQMVSCLVISV